MKTKFEEIASQICDCHVHYGQFREDHYDPEQVVQWFDLTKVICLQFIMFNKGIVSFIIEYDVIQ